MTDDEHFTLARIEKLFFNPLLGWIEYKLRQIQVKINA